MALIYVVFCNCLNSTRVEIETSVKNGWLDQPSGDSKTEYSTLKKNLVNGVKKIEIFFDMEKLDGSNYRKDS